MMQLTLADHAILHCKVVEIRDEGGSLMGMIYPQQWGVRLVSKYLDGRRPEQVAIDPTIPPALEVRLP